MQIRLNQLKFNCLFFVLMFLPFTVCSQTVITSLADLITYAGKSNVNVKMQPGVYKITTTDFGSAKTFKQDTIFSFKGSNSTFDFTGVTFEFNTAIFQAFGSVDVIEVAVLGSNIVLKNLTMTDIGTTRPSKTALGLLLEGVSNRVEGFKMTIRGSQPYGYGDIFGKGSGYVIKHYKHAAILVRGDQNHLLNDTIIHRAYGHGIFCQGSVDALIEGCYVEGEMRTTDAVLAEKGTGTSADGVNFMSVWGYTVPAGYMFSYQEDGIRCYNTGMNLATGVERNTKNITVKNCTIKNMRSGVTIGFCDGTKYVENCTALGCENGFWAGSGAQIVNCSGDAKYGHLYTTAYQTDKNNTVNIKVLDNSGAYGNDVLAYIGGSGQNVTFTVDSTLVAPTAYMRIMLSGIKTGLRDQLVDVTYNDFTNTTAVVKNYTNYPVIIDAKCSNSTGVSGGAIVDNGTNNSFVRITVDGKTTKTAIDSHSADKTEAFIVPNVVHNELCVVNHENSNFELFDCTGIRVYNDLIKSNKQSINVSALQSGVYFAIVMKDGVAQKQKFIKN